MPATIISTPKLPIPAKARTQTVRRATYAHGVGKGCTKLLVDSAAAATAVGGLKSAGRRVNRDERGSIGGPGKGEDWPQQVPRHDCTACAGEIQQRIGGEIHRIETHDGSPMGPSANNPTGDWRYHDVVVKDGRVYDSFTGPEGRPIEEYKARFEDRDRLVFDF